MAQLTVKLLVVEGDAEVASGLRDRLEKAGCRVKMAGRVDEALRILQQEAFDIVFVDLLLPDRPGLEVLRAIKASPALTEVLVLAAEPQGESAREAVRQGAVLALGMPVDPAALDRALEQVRERIQGTRHGLAVERLVRTREVFPQIVAESRAMREVLAVVEKVSPSDAPILILGESGTGKELVARTIHLKSPRKKASYLPLNCAGLTDTLLESELFGHEKGSFTGAGELRRGLFEVAHMGTLFLDEIGEMAAGLQASFLRVLESGEFRRVGGTVSLSTDVRIVAATNRNLSTAIQEGKFRKDLFYRLNTVVLNLPSLRERREDIWPLAQYCLGIICREAGKTCPFTDDVPPVLEKYPWPGNVRELWNLVERLVLLSDRESIRATDLPLDFGRAEAEIAGGTSPAAAAEGTLQPLAEIEKRHILRVLERMNNNRRETAKVLQISEPTLYRKLKAYGVNV